QDRAVWSKGRQLQPRALRERRSRTRRWSGSGRGNGAQDSRAEVGRTSNGLTFATYTRDRNKMMDSRNLVKGETQISLAIIIPAANEAERIGACLEALAASDDPGTHVEVIVVANGCTDA